MSSVSPAIMADKYRPYPTVPLPDRRWPSRVIEHAPIWCSVDLRDGNQALVNPMNTERKSRMFRHLVAMGFKEIEVGFPAASQTDFDFVRMLIEQRMIPDDVTIQVLTQSRAPLIERTFDAIRGARKAIVHLYNSTSAVQRRVVFGMDRESIIDIAVSGAGVIRELAVSMPETEIVHQYSPESFTGTELDFAVAITDAVMAVWQPTPGHRAIVNLPATVEMATPNVYADRIEWFGRHVAGRDSLIVSVHTHNDRGSAVAAAELALLAGAERIEGTLFGNGERTGNVDLVTLGLNMLTQGVDPGLDFSNLDATVEMAEACTGLPVHPRHPYAGALVYTAFSGSHQDAIRKGLAARRGSNSGVWEVPYLPLDPADVGRSCDEVIRVNSQSGKGGVAFIMERDHGFQLPRSLQVEFSRVVQTRADHHGGEVAPEVLWSLFEAEYLSPSAPGTGYELLEHVTKPSGRRSPIQTLTATVRVGDHEVVVTGSGNGPIDALVNGLRRTLGVDIAVKDYHEHALGGGSDAVAVAYVEIADSTGVTRHGIGRDANIVTASLRAVLAALSRVAVV